MDAALQAMFDLAFFHDNGFVRQQCPKCGHHYWALDPESPDCGDSTCREYGFLGKPLSKKPLGLPEMREAFLAYWEKKGHTRVPRNPVVARWRDDIYLNIASIANYQPHVTSGDCPPPANPLVVSQPCIRLNDLANIGRSGRHFSCFEMMGHHAFNSPEWGEHYWTEECVAGGHEFLTKVLGLDPQALTYVEAVWAGGGNAGPCVEVFAGGLEVATLVFMCLAEDEDGEFDIKGDKYAMMDLRIIDTGWGLERLAWASQGTPSAYETVFPDTLQALRKLAAVSIADDQRAQKIVETHAIVQGVLNLDVGMKLDALREEVVTRLKDHGIDTTVEELESTMGPVESLYALADHLRCLSFMVGDGLVPGNVKAGYLMRLMFRRAFRFAKDLGIHVPLSDLLADNMQRMLGDFPEFEAAIGRAREMADLEQERYQETQAKGKRIVHQHLTNQDFINEQAGGVDELIIPVDYLVKVYDTHGISPPDFERHAKSWKGRYTKTVRIKDYSGFDVLLAEQHSQEKKPKPKQIVPADVPATRRIFYEDDGQWQQEFDAEVTWVAPPKLRNDVFPVIEFGKPVPADGKEHAFEPLPPNHPCETGRMGFKHRDQTHWVEIGNIQLVTLSASAFFHETGGQPGDRGILVLENGLRLTVLKIDKDGEHPVHYVEDPTGALKVGTKVHGVVDWDQRMDHTRSHTATHIMNQAVRRVLGQHSWQAGTQKYRNCARVDMSHFRRPTRSEVAAIEQLANQVVMQGRPVFREWWQRHEAETKWGVTLLQGGIPKGTDVRVVRVGPAPDGTDDADFDVEYCGGTHCATTHGVGPIKVYRTERIQDGVERFEYSAGRHAVERWQGDEIVLRNASAELGVSPDELPAAAKRFFSEWKEQRKLLDEIQGQLAELKAAAAAGDAEEVNGVRIIVQDDLDPGALQQTAKELLGNGKTVALLAAPAGDQVRLLFGRSEDVDVDMGALLRDATAVMGGKGGGRPDFAQGAGPDASKLGAALEAAKAAVQDAIA